MECESVIVVIIHPAPTPCTSPPRLETSVAIQRARKFWFWKGAKVELLDGTSPVFLMRAGSTSIEAFRTGAKASFGDQCAPRRSAAGLTFLNHVTYIVT
jgi:hypothetical protein